MLLFSVRTSSLTAPSSPPLNSSGEVLGPTTLSITWQPPAPEGQNGIITSYTVLITEVLTNTTTTYQRDGSRTELLIPGLHPYYDYNCSVAAETSVGLGPFATPFTVTTQQDGECMCLVVLCVLHVACFNTNCYPQHPAHHLKVSKGVYPAPPVSS